MYSVVWCGVVWCGAVRCGAVRCGAVRCGAVRCGAVRCGVVWYGIVLVWTWPQQGCLYTLVHVSVGEYVCVCNVLRSTSVIQWDRGHHARSSWHCAGECSPAYHEVL